MVFEILFSRFLGFRGGGVDPPPPPGGVVYHGYEPGWDAETPSTVLGVKRRFLGLTPKAPNPKILKILQNR